MAKWTIDPTHSEIGFKVKHLMISTVSGKFNTFSVDVETSTDDNFENASISFSADVDSITTGMDQRDTHLKSDDFFNAASFPQLTFKSTRFTKKDGDEFSLEGDLTIRDVTQPIALDVIYSGLMQDFYGNWKAGFEAKGKINRKDFNLKWSATTEAGGVVVADEVKLNLDLQLQRQ